MILFSHGSQSRDAAKKLAPASFLREDFWLGETMKINTLFALLLSLVIYQGHVHADDINSTRTIASFTIGPNPKDYSIRVRNCADDLTHIKLRVTDNGVIVEGAGVTYTDGTTDSYSFSQTFQAGYESSWLSLDSFRTPDHCIASVFVNVHAIDPRPAHVDVFGNFK